MTTGFVQLFDRLRRRLGGGTTALPVAPDMTGARWEQVQDALTAALELPPSDRAAYLDGACAGDAALRREVDSLLVAHESPGILDRPAAAVIAPLVTPPFATGADGDRTVSHYQILEPLGGGGMGVVYRARDLRLGRIVALKFLPPLLSADERAKERFLVEARTAAALDHPNICTIHEIGETRDGQLFIAMPCYEGETLRRRIDAGPLPVDQALAFAIQTAHGLGKAHDRGIVHRDIKPANLMVTADGTIKIVDFGIAKLADVTLTNPGTTPGTVAYMSPEQARGQPVDARTDIWSLGVVLHEMLTGSRPFQGAHDQVVLHAILHDDPPPVTDRRPGIPATLSRIVQRMLTRPPDGRYATVHELVTALEQLGDAASVGLTDDATAHSVPVPARGAHVVAPHAAEVGDGAAGLSPEGERRQATIVVSNLAGYAGLVEQLVPDELDRLMRQLRDCATEIATRHGGALHRFSGEEIVLLFGVPTTHEDDCLRATRAAVELHVRVRELRVDPALHGTRPIGLHTGIDTGRVAAQSTDGDAYRIAGVAPQTAAQVAAYAADDEIWITPECQRLIGPFFHTEPRAPLTFRDREQPVLPHRVGAESGLQTRLEAAELVRLTAFTGREEELATLARCLDDARRGAGQFVTVTGDAGVGKSRLLYEFRRLLDREQVTLLQGRCQSYGSNIAYLPFIETLRGSLGLREGRAPGGPREDPVARIREIGAELEEFIPLYLHLLSIPHDGFAVPKHLQGEEFRPAMQEALAAILTLGAERRPTVLLLEDWHWVDDASHAALQHIVEMVSDYPLLVVATYRPGYAVDWENPSHHTAVPLRPLEASSSLAMLRSVLRAECVPEELGALLHERTGGNPFFLEEISQTLLEDGTLRVDGERAVLLGSLTALDLPDTVQAVIRTRLDRLDREARDVLRQASVVGREFTRALLERVFGSAARLPNALQALKAAGLIQQTRVVPEAAYRFKHVLTQEVAYASLLEHQRKELHGRVGEAIERLHRDRIEEQLERLAHHFSRAEAWWKAVHYGMRSEERAAALSQFAEALQILERAQDCLARLPEGADREDALVELLLRQERLCETLGLRGRQQRIIGELIALLEPAGDRAKLAEVYLRQGDVDTLLRRFAAAEAALQGSLGLRRQLGDAAGERNTLRSLGLLRWHQDRNEEALHFIEQALAIDRQLEDVDAIIGDLSNMGPVLKAMGQYERARVQLEEALALSEQPRPEERHVAVQGEASFKPSYILQNLANIHRELGDTDRALEYLYRAMALTTEKRLPIKLSYHLTTIAHIHLQRGEVAQSLQRYQEAVELTRKAKFVPGLAQSLRFFGELLLGLGRHRDALPHFQEAAALFAQLKDHATEAAMWSRTATVHEQETHDAEAMAAWSRARTLHQQAEDPRGELEALEGIARTTRRHVAEPTLALGYYREALELADALADRRAAGRLHNAIGILEWSRGEYERALAEYERAFALFMALGDEAGAGLMLNSIGATLRDVGRRDEARRRLEEAIALHRRSGQPRLESHALAILGDVCAAAGDVERAMTSYERSLRIRREVGDRLGEGWMLHHLARARLARGFVEPGRELTAQAAGIAAEIGDQELAEACERLRRMPSL